MSNFRQLSEFSKFSGIFKNYLVYAGEVFPDAGSGHCRPHVVCHCRVPGMRRAVGTCRNGVRIVAQQIGSTVGSSRRQARSTSWEGEEMQKKRRSSNDIIV
jgi:hypothetical protein